MTAERELAMNPQVVVAHDAPSELMSQPTVGVLRCTRDIGGSACVGATPSTGLAAHRTMGVSSAIAGPRPANASHRVQTGCDNGGSTNTKGIAGLHKRVGLGWSPRGSGQPCAEPASARQLARWSNGERVRRPYPPAPLQRDVGSPRDAGCCRRLTYRCR